MALPTSRGKNFRRAAVRSLASACVLLSPVMLTAQSAPAAPSDATCKSQPKTAGCPSKDSAAPAAPADSSTPAKALPQQFPFPTEDSRRGGETQGSGTVKGSANGLPEMPTTDVPDPPAASEKPMHLPPSGYSTSGGDDDSSTGGSGSSGSSSRSGDDDDVAPTTAAPNAPVKATKLKDLGSHADMSGVRAKLEETRVTDDLKIGRFYLQEGNTQGAYLRFKDAVERAPDDPDARFALAEAANRMNKRDEAVVNYQECLKLDPAGDHDKASRKALQKLGIAAR